jgi:2-hydroxychromene-2-carboxylate isomerase
MKTARWYFDFISPYSYLQHAVLARFDGLVQIEPVPILFAGLLEHHGQKGPAEIPVKKIHTFREVAWRAHQQGIAFALPPAHPFNPLRLLRLAIALECTPAAIDAIFRFVWVQGCLPDDEPAFKALCDRLGVNDPDAAIGRAEVKDALRRNTSRAIEEGVFGVPTLAFDDQHFWGFDMTDAALACLRGDAFFDSPIMQRATTLPDGVQRRTR